MVIFGLLACEPGTALLLGLDVEVRPSRWVPSAFRAEWDGPAGTASVWIVDPRDLSDADLRTEPSGAPWRKVATAEVEDGPSGLPITLLPAGRHYELRIGVERDGGPTTWSPLQSLTIPEAPELLGAPAVTFVDEDRSEVAAGGWIVTHRYATLQYPNEAMAVILDHDGQIVWWMDPLPTGQRVIRVRESRDLHSVLVLQDHPDGPDLIQRISLDGETRIDTPTPDASHDFAENADGTFTYIGYTWTESGLIPDVPYPVAVDVLRTVPEGDPDPSRIENGFSFLGDFPSAPSLSCPHTEPDHFVPGSVDWIHSNSLVRAPSDDGWIVMSRHLNALLGIGDDRSRLWQAGGADGTLTASSESALFHHSHASHAWSDGDTIHVLVFDNGDHTPTPIVSRVVEVRIDPAAGTFDAVWELPDPLRRFTPFLGDARRLPGGNTLVTWTAKHEIIEYTPEGDEVWRFEGDERFGRSIWVPTLSP